MRAGKRVAGGGACATPSRGQDKERGLAGVPGGDLFLWEQMLAFAKGSLPSVKGSSVAWAAPGGSRVLLQRPPPGGGGGGRLSWPGPVTGAGGGAAEGREAPRALGPGAWGPEPKVLVGPAAPRPSGGQGRMLLVASRSRPCAAFAPQPPGGPWEPWTEAGDAWLRQAVGWGEPGAKEKLLKCLAIAPSEKPVPSQSPGLAA